MSQILILANEAVGLYKFRKELIQTLLDRGDAVFISLPYGELVEPLVGMGCTYINTDVDRRRINPFAEIKLVKLYFKMIRRIKPDLVITYTIKPNIYGGIVSKVMKVPYATNITGLGSAFENDGFLKKIVMFLYKTTCKTSKVVFFENEENQRFFIDSGIVQEEKTCKLCGAGVNLEEYRFVEYPEDNGEIRFLYIGRVMKEKGIEELFQAARKIKNEYINVVFDIVGGLEEDYGKTIRQLEQQGILNYHGYQKDVKPFIEKSNCFIMPSYHEGMSNTVLECGSMGRPLITSNIFGCKEAVLDGETGYLVKVKSEADLYEKIKKFIELSYQDKKIMAANSRKHIQSVFDKKLVVYNTIQELKKYAGTY